jgi:hypothetical protein
MIGGEHFLLPPRTVVNSMMNMLAETATNLSFFASGRDAFYSLLRTLPHKAVYLPDLICGSVYLACLQAGKAVNSYRMTSNLVQHETVLPAQELPSCLMVMHYFGLTNWELMRNAKSLGMTVISDVTHMLFNRDQMKFICEHSDYLVASLRKSGPFPDGGFLLSCHHSVPSPSRGIREDFFSLRAAGLLSRGFSAGSGFSNDENFHLLQKAEGLIDQSPAGDYQCSYFTRKLLETINIDENAKLILGNATTLSNLLSGCCGTVNIAVGPSPYYLCLFQHQEERDAARAQLASRQYFCPIHWDTSQMPTPSPLSSHILSIPCDARYTSVDMGSVATVIKACIN